MKRALFMAILIGFIMIRPLPGQDIVKVRGEYTMKQEDNMTRLETLEQVELQAMIHAIDSAFGRVVEQESDIRLKDNKVSYNIIGSTRVKADWIRTIKKTFDISCYPDDVDGQPNAEIWITCRIEGEARKTLPRPDLEVETRNCPDPSCATCVFQYGDFLYVSFRSPVNGFLSIFIEAGDTTYRLFPYSSMGAQSYHSVEGDMEYLLFSDDKKYDYFPGYPADILEMRTTSESEVDIIYIVFSENEAEKYFKPSLSAIKAIENDYRMPRSMKTEDFTEWLYETRKSTNDFFWERFQVTIENK
jgi:hypothetical protein